MYKTALGGANRATKAKTIFQMFSYVTEALP